MSLLLPVSDLNLYLSSVFQSNLFMKVKIILLDEFFAVYVLVTRTKTVFMFTGDV